MLREIPDNNYLFVKRMFNSVYDYKRKNIPNLDNWCNYASEQGKSLMDYDVSGFYSRLPKMPEIDRLIHFLQNGGEYPLDDRQRFLSVMFVMLFKQDPNILDKHNIYSLGTQDNSRANFKHLSAKLFADYLHRKNSERELLSPLYGAFLHKGTFEFLSSFPQLLQNCGNIGDFYHLMGHMIPQNIANPKNPYVGWWGSLHPELYNKSWGTGGVWEEYGDLLDETILQRDIFALYLHHPKQTEKIHSLLKILGLYRHELYCQSQEKLDKEELIHIMSLHKNTRRTIISNPAYFYELESSCV